MYDLTTQEPSKADSNKLTLPTDGFSELGQIWKKNISKLIFFTSTHEGKK